MGGLDGTVRTEMTTTETMNWSSAVVRRPRNTMNSASFLTVLTYDTALTDTENALTAPSQNALP